MKPRFALTIVIPCKEDPRLPDCIASIDVDCEILVVLNGSSDEYCDRISAALSAPGVVVERLAKPNLSAALEHGVRAARHDAILLMDSDCLFDPGSIASLVAAMEDDGSGNAVFKGTVCFDIGPGILSPLIARTRHLHTAAPPTAYKPPLLIQRSLAPRIGGYFFDPRLLWKEDADLDWRLRQAGVAIVPVPHACIRHAPLDLQSDLRSNFRYGVGAAQGELLAIPLTSPDRSLLPILKSDGLAVAAYMGLANLARTMGYHWTLATSTVNRPRTIRVAAGSREPAPPQRQ